MKFYVMATDRQGSEMRQGGIVLMKLIIICDNKGQALSVSRMLKERKERYNAIQLTTNQPTVNPRIYNPKVSEASTWLQGRA